MESALPTLYTAATEFGHTVGHDQLSILQQLLLVRRAGWRYQLSILQRLLLVTRAGWRYQLFILQRLLFGHAWSRRYQLFILQLLLLVTRAGWRYQLFMLQRLLLVTRAVGMTNSLYNSDYFWSHMASA